MVVIKKLASKGFKSFAYKTELVFGNGFNCVIGPNGAGKSIKGNSLVLFPDGSKKEIGKLVDEEISKSKQIKNLDHGVYCDSEKDSYVLSVNPITFKQEYKKIVKYIKHKGEKDLFEITTRTGKKITTTGCHSILIFKEGCINGVRVDSLKENELLAVPRSLNIKTDIDFLPREINSYVEEIIECFNLKKNKSQIVNFENDGTYLTRQKLKNLLDVFVDKWFDLYGLYNSLDKCYAHLSNNFNNKTQAVGTLQLTKDIEELYTFENQFLEEHLDYSLKLLTLLNRISNSDILWDQIAKIEKINGDEYVYDIEIEDNHNFIANGIFVHNSNIMDSLCFVLGKSSAKEMRAEKSANLIFHGNKQHSAAKEAEVTITFDNSTKKFPLQTDDVSITRIVRQNGTSIYKINDEVLTRQQVLDVLNAARIDPDGHNIILQGDIISFTEMKPDERRKVMEEISGISMYEDKKQKCLLELQKVDAKLNETEIILTERATNLKELKKERDEAIRFKELEGSIKDNKATFTHLHIKDKEVKVDEIEKRKKEAEDQIARNNKEIETIKNEINNHKEEIKRINEEIEVKGEKEQLTLRKEIEELKTNIIKANSRLDVCKNELEKIKARKEQLINNTKEIENKIKELKENKVKELSEIKNNENNEKSVNERISKFKEKHGIGNDLGSTFEELDNKIDNFLSEVNKLNEERQNSLRQKDQATFRLNAAEERLMSLQSSNVKELKDTKNKFRNITEKLNNCLNEETVLIAQVNKARHEYSQNSEDLAKLKARQIGIQEVSLGDLAVRKILELKKTLKGIYGTVAELGNVDSRYATALEIAAGSRIKSIVVDSDVVAQKCIEHLKQHKLGTATFLPLNKIKARIAQENINNLINKKGVHGLAIELVRFDPMYKDVFSYVLGSTLIVDDLDVGRRIGIGNARMVTLEGDLMEPSGAMIGGYRTTRAGTGFREKEVDESVKKLDEEVKRIKTLIEHLENKKVENEVLIGKLRSDKANLEAEIIKVEKTLNIEGVDAGKLLEDKKNFSLEIKNFELGILNCENKIKTINKELEILKDKREKAKEKLSSPEVSKDLTILEDEKLKLKEHYLTIQSNIKNIDTQINSMLLPEREKTEKIIKQHEKENEDFLKEHKEIEEILKIKNNELKNKENDEKRFYSNFKDSIGKRNKFTEKIQKFETNQIREEEKIKGVEQKLNNISIDRAKVIAELEGLKKEFEQFGEVTIRRGLSLEDLKSRIFESERELNKIGNVNLRALEVYESIQKEYESIIEKVSKLKVEKEDVLLMMNEIETKKKDIFLKTYNSISKGFKEIFSQLTTKGEASLELENKETPLESGVDIQIKMAGNKYIDMKSLSGGEKTLAALALIFAIQEYAPSPFYLLDEVDAALDKRNSEMLSRFLQKYSAKAQYIVISHNDNVMCEAEYLYGVSMQNGITKVVSLKV